jgi:hypothetical protein
MKMSRRTLSNIEHLAEVNMACSARLAGRLSLSDLRTALACAQRRHPALRALIRPENDVLYYEPDAAPEIPVRIVRLVADDVYRSQWEFELTTAFHPELPQLRVVYFDREFDCELLFTVSHRVCDGVGIFIIAKDILQFLANRAERTAYRAIGATDIIGGYRPARPWLTAAGVSLINGCLSLLPGAGPTPKRQEYVDEWSAGCETSAFLRQRCKTEGVSVHVAFLIALDRALFAVFGRRSPKWITCPIDLRRGRFPVLKEDMLFYGGGNFKVRSGRWIKGDFWRSARALTAEVRAQVEREVADIPRRLFLFEQLRPLRCRQARWLVRASDALQSKRRVRGIGMSNLGNINFAETDCPLPIKDIRFSVRSLNFGILALIPYTVNEDMRFYWTASNSFTSEYELHALEREFAHVLTQQMESKRAKTATA